MDTSALPARAGILIVDDFQPFRVQLKTLLERRPEYFLAGEAADGVEAVELAGELHPDIVLLDIGLPRMHGLDAAGHIAACSPASKLIFVTQDGCSAVAEAALEQYGSGFVVKTDVGRELLNAIDVVLKGRKYVPNRFADCAWAENLHSVECHNAPAEVHQLVRANAVLASARAAASKYQNAARARERLLRQARREREDKQREHDDVYRRYNELLGRT